MACSCYHHDNEVDLKNFSPELRQQMQVYRIDMLAFTSEEAETIANFLSTDDRDRRFRSELAWNDDDFRLQVYFNLYDLIELLSQNTPLSILDKHMDTLSVLIHRLKRMFDGEWLRELELLKDYHRYRHEVVEDLEFIEKDLKEKSWYIQRRMKDRLNCMRNCDDQLRRRFLELFQKQLKYEEELMRVRAKLKCVLNARAKLASLEFNIFSCTIIQKKVKRYNTTYPFFYVFCSMLCFFVVIVGNLKYMLR
jgi:hypothetical protein